MVDQNDDDLACAEHGLAVLPDGYDRCPYCKMEEAREAHLVERATRHHPKSVDDPASIDAYRR